MLYDETEEDNDLAVHHRLYDDTEEDTDLAAHYNEELHDDDDI